MAYKKVVSGAGVVSVFTTETRKYPSCVYCVIKFPDEFVNPGCWAVVEHHSARHLGHGDAVETIGEEEYREHIKFALRILENQAMGTPLEVITTSRPRLVNALTYDQHAKQQAG